MKALFLDRDGIINIDHGYIHKIEDFEFSKGIFELLKLFINQGYLLFIVTNQSGIGRSYYSANDFRKLTIWMLAELKKKNIKIEKVYHCPHAPEEKCKCRKPETGMITKCLSTYDINLKNSWLIGDKQSDIDLGINVGIGRTIAIGKRKFKNYSYFFKTVSQCKEYLEENQGRILHAKNS